MNDEELAAALVREAAALAARMRADGVGAERKTSVSDIVTAADRAAESLVLERLRAERPDDSILGEEGAEHVGTSGRTWVIDPVDGTYNFHRGLDWWCSALALRDGDDLLLGAVHHVREDATFVGGPGLHATRNAVALPALADVPMARACAATYLHPGAYDAELGAAFSRGVAGLATLRMLGSASMDATAVAQGRLDLLIQHSAPEWDELPGAALIRSVGGLTRSVEAGGVRWHVAGAPTAVTEVCAALTASGR